MLLLTPQAIRLPQSILKAFLKERSENFQYMAIGGTERNSLELLSPPAQPSNSVQPSWLPSFDAI